MSISATPAALTRMLTDERTIAGAAEQITTDVLSTRPPQQVLEPHGRNSFAIGDGASKSTDEKHVDIDVTRASSTDDGLHPAPTEEELNTLRKVSDKVPMVIWLLCLVEFSERASYYGAKTVFSNFMMYPLPEGGTWRLMKLLFSGLMDIPGNGAGAPAAGTQGTAGALGKGLQFANAFVLLFSFLAYVIPILGAWIADTRWGRFKTIVIGVIICFVAHIIMIFGALPSVLRAGRGLAPFIVSLLVLAFGAGKSEINCLKKIYLMSARSFQAQRGPSLAGPVLLPEAVHQGLTDRREGHC